MTTLNTPDAADMVANIISVYAQATDAQLVAGAQWYAEAHRIAGALCDGDTERGAAILAVLSPVLSWEKNIAAAIAAAKPRGRRPAGVIGRNWDKARAARRKGADLDKIVRGEKVRNFWLCIASNGLHESAVCVDRHAAAIAYGYFLDGEEASAAVSGKKRYKALADAYRDAADILGVLPATVQAVTWVVWRDTPWRDRPAA